MLKLLRNVLLGALFVALGCEATPSTQVTVRVVPEDQALADQIEQLQYRVAGPRLTYVPARYPFDIAIVREGEVPDDFRVEVSAELTGDTVIAAVATGAFVANEHREVVLVLEHACVDTTCADGLSCEAGACRRDRVATAPYREGGVPTIIPRRDGGVDASVDVGMDVSEDVGMDVSEDVGMDVSEDVGMDVSEDAGADVAEDAGMDTRADVETDADVDAGCISCRIAALPCRTGCRVEDRCMLSDDVPDATACGAGVCASGVCIVTGGVPITPSAPAEETEWGRRVFIGNNIVLVGQPALGRAHAFQRSGDRWTERWTTAYDATFLNDFGFGLGSDGERLFVGGNGTSATPTTYTFANVFDEIGTTTMGGDNSGMGASIAYGRRLVLGSARGWDEATRTNTGHVQEFDPYSQYRPPVELRTPTFGYGRAVAANDEYLAIGALGYVELRTSDGTRSTLTESFTSEAPDFGKALALLDSGSVAVLANDGVRVFSRTGDQTGGLIAGSFSCLAATDRSVLVGDGSGAIASYRLRRGAWVNTHSYESAGATDLGQSCSAFGARLVAGGPRNRVVTVFTVD